MEKDHCADLISIIICSTRRVLDVKLVENIQNTIGSKHEIVCIDNSDCHRSIFSAYEEGVKLAKGNFLCFMHEDILFRSHNWGEKCIEQLEGNNQIGMLGVLGGYYMSRHSCNWLSSGLIKGHVIQGFVKGKHDEVEFRHSDYNHYGNDVVAIDGLWMFIRRNLFGKYLKWDTENYEGFHFYDSDMSMQVINSGHKIAIADILIEHKSSGNYNKNFWNNYLAFHAKWKDFLPVINGNVTFADRADADYREMRTLYLSKIENLELLWILNRIHFNVFYHVYSTINRKIRNIVKHLNIIWR